MSQEDVSGWEHVSPQDKPALEAVLGDNDGWEELAKSKVFGDGERRNEEREWEKVEQGNGGGHNKGGEEWEAVSAGSAQDSGLGAVEDALEDAHLVQRPAHADGDNDEDGSEEGLDAPRWAALEANATWLTQLLTGLGMGPEAVLHHVLALDGDALAHAPPAPSAVVVAFPLAARNPDCFTHGHRNRVYTHPDGRKEVVWVSVQHSHAQGDGVTIWIPSLQRERQTVQDRLEALSPSSPPTTTSSLFVRQHAHNSGGTIALVHAAAHAVATAAVSPVAGGWLAGFLKTAGPLSPNHAGKLLAGDELVARLHNDTANQAHPSTPSTPPLHFTCFVVNDGSVWELDGQRSTGPLCHGPSAGKPLLQHVARVVREEIVNERNGNSRCHVLALAPPGPSHPEVDMKLVAQVVAMGFGRNAAVSAVHHTHNTSVNDAVEFILSQQPAEHPPRSSARPQAASSPQPQQRPPLQQPGADVSKVQVLMGMGFDADKCAQALVATNGDTEQAVTWLLDN